MLENNWSLKILAGAAGVTLALGLAVSVGAVPQLGDNGSVHAAAVTQADEVGTTGTPASDHPTVQAPPASTPAAAPTSVAPTTTPTTKVPVTTKATTPTTKAPATPKTTQAPAAAAPTPTPAAAASTAVPRRTPSAAEVQSVITQLKQQVGGILMLVSPTPAQIAQAGDQICTAFDNGQTFAQVKATGLSMIPASITVSPATVDWAVRTAVALYCPGHANKLV